MIYIQIFADNFHVEYSHKLVNGYMENLLTFVFYGLFFMDEGLLVSGVLSCNYTVYLH